MSTYLDTYVTTRDMRAAINSISAGRLPLAGVEPAGVPKLLAAWLEAWPYPATGLLEFLCGQSLALRVLDGGDSELTARSAHRLKAGPEDGMCRWRHGLLETATGHVAAHTALVWLPARLPEDARDALDAGGEPAGVILGRLGARRADRHALASCTGDGPTGAVQSSAVLTLGGVPVALAKEAVTRSFAESLAEGVSHE